MDVQDQFARLTALVCEPVRAKMLWALLEGKACTATELAAFANSSGTSASNHLSRLLEAGILKVENQGRHRYYSFSNAEVAYAIEGLALLVKPEQPAKTQNGRPAGIKYCRTCYDHLAGYAGVQLVEKMEHKGYLKKADNSYLVTKKGWQWLKHFSIEQNDYLHIRRPLTRQCLDWSERRPHLAGQLGADLLTRMFQKKWLKKVQFSRELVITAKGRQEIYAMLGLAL